MAHIIDRAPVRKDYVVYAIPSPYEKKIFINYTPSDRLYKTYIEHIGLRVTKTRDLFSKAKEDGIIPAIYSLDTQFATKQEAFRMIVAWTRYFRDKGFSQLFNDILQDYSDDLMPNTEAYYDIIKGKPLTSVFSPEGGCFPNYKPKIEVPLETKKKKNCTFTVDSNEYETILKNASAQRMSIGQYCRRMALYGHIIEADMSFFTPLMASYRHVKVFIQQIMHSIYVTGKYYPADMVNLQKMCDDITEIHLEMIKKLNELIETLSK